MFSKSMKGPKEIVREGYDRLSDSYRKKLSSTHSDLYEGLTSELISLLRKNDSILELGCGDGLPVARSLSTDYVYTGIDISPVQISNARRNVPEASFVAADMTALKFLSGSFGAIVALYSIIHVPLEEQYALFKNVHDWIRPYGYFLCIVGSTHWTGIENDWIDDGVSMYWSHGDAESYSQLFTSVGFTILRKEFVSEKENGHMLFLLQRTSPIYQD